MEKEAGIDRKSEQKIEPRAPARKKGSLIDASFGATARLPKTLTWGLEPVSPINQSEYNAEIFRFSALFDEIISRISSKSSMLNIKSEITELYRDFISYYSKVFDSGLIINGEVKHFSENFLVTSNVFFSKFNSAICAIGHYIETDKQSNHNTDDPFELIERFAKENDGDGVAEFAKSIFDSLLASKAEAKSEIASTLPDKAPENYAGLRNSEAPPQFIKRVYAPWLGKGLTRAHIRKLDPALSTAINNWLTKPQNKWPEDVDLPTKAEQNSRDIERLHAGDAIGEFTKKEFERVRSALRRRSK